jgi:hypothetical protein
MPAAFVIAARQLAESPAVALHVDWCQARLMSACPPIAAHYRTSPEVAEGPRAVMRQATWTYSIAALVRTTSDADKRA